MKTASAIQPPARRIHLHYNHVTVIAVAVGKYTFFLSIYLSIITKLVCTVHSDSTRSAHFVIHLPRSILTDFAIVFPYKVQVFIVPNRRRIGHVVVIIASKCSHVWMGGGKMGYLGLDEGLSGAEK